MRQEYKYALSITSQLPFCSIPFRLDSYSSCQFACRYCFASARGGFKGNEKIQVANPDVVERRLKRLLDKEPASVVDELLAARIPIHFGGMSDPFSDFEIESRTTLRLLNILADYAYPTIISTKGTLAARSPYRDVLSRGNFVVQVSLSMASADLSAKVDVGAPTPEDRLRTLSVLAERGIATACRIQPLLPRYEQEAFELIESCGNLGVRQIAVEHLKLPIETGPRGGARISQALSFDVHTQYMQRGAQRMGREWVLPVEQRLPLILELRSAAWAMGLAFGAADSDLLHLSDGMSCCSGIDTLGFETGYRFTFTHAIHASKDGLVRFSDIEDEWRPGRSIGRYVNSSSRLAQASVDEYVRRAWNGAANGPSPAMYYGVTRTDQVEDSGLAIYRIAPDVQALMSKHCKQDVNWHQGDPRKINPDLLA